MLEVLGFHAHGVARAQECHTVVIRDKSGTAIAIIVSHNSGLTEVLTPEHPDFKRTAKILETATQVKIHPADKVRVERGS